MLTSESDDDAEGIDCENDSCDEDRAAPCCLPYRARIGAASDAWVRSDAVAASDVHRVTQHDEEAANDERETDDGLSLWPMVCASLPPE